MNTQPPGFAHGQTASYPRARIGVEVEPQQLARWQRLQASAAKIVAYSIANHIYASLRVRAFHERIVESWTVLNDSNFRNFAVEFVDWNVDDLLFDFNSSSFESSFDGLSRAMGALGETAGVRVAWGDEKGRFCNGIAARCRGEFGDSTTLLREQHAKAKAGRAALDGSANSRRYAETLEHVEVVAECANLAHEGILRAMQSAQHKTEATYNEAVTFVSRAIAARPPADWRHLSAIHLQKLARELRAQLNAAPAMRDELLALRLDQETRALISSCQVRSSPSKPVTTLKMAAWKGTKPPTKM